MSSSRFQEKTTTLVPQGKSFLIADMRYFECLTAVYDFSLHFLVLALTGWSFSRNDFILGFVLSNNKKILTDDNNERF